jgi:sulfur carrier protein ThiS adenylyltransferase
MVKKRETEGATKRQMVRQRLQKAHVGIAGIGGLGSNAAVALTRAGLGHLTIVDFDVVEEDNLDRQYYFRDQIGQQKVDALAKTLRQINPHINLTPVSLKLEKGSMDKPFHAADVIIEALDNAGTKTSFIEEIQLKLPGIPLVAASGVAGFGQPDRIKTIHSGTLHLCYDNQAPSSDDDVLMASHVALMANWEADLAIKLIVGEHHDPSNKREKD